MLLPQGNYAARVWYHEAIDTWVVWNFYFRDGTTRGEHLLPPPKEIVVADSGLLRLRSYRGFDWKVTSTARGDDLTPLEPLFGRPDTVCETMPPGVSSKHPRDSRRS